MLGDHGGRQRVGADGAADGARRQWVQVVLPPQDTARRSARAVPSPGPGPIGDFGSGFTGDSVEVDVILGEWTAGRP